MNTTLLKEASFVGILTVLIGSLIGYLFSKLRGTTVPSPCANWNKNHIMEISLFVTGFILHLICEYTNINKYYCKKGYACTK